VVQPLVALPLVIGFDELTPFCVPHFDTDEFPFEELGWQPSLVAWPYEPDLISLVFILASFWPSKFEVAAEPL
jgi:hypothetical protein